MVNIFHCVLESSCCKSTLSYSKHVRSNPNVDFTSSTKKIRFAPFTRPPWLPTAKSTLDLLIHPTSLVRKKSLIVNNPFCNYTANKCSIIIEQMPIVMTCTYQTKLCLESTSSNQMKKLNLKPIAWRKGGQWYSPGDNLTIRQTFS